MKKVDECLKNLISSSEPERLGKAKRGSLRGYYAYRINKQHRILYTVQRDDETVLVTLHRVCDHKQVYDKG